MAVDGFAGFVNAFAVSDGTPAGTCAEYVKGVQGQGAKGSVPTAAEPDLPVPHMSAEQLTRRPWENPEPGEAIAG
jgi:hypothetical protein